MKSLTLILVLIALTPAWGQQATTVCTSTDNTLYLGENVKVVGGTAGGVDVTCSYPLNQPKPHRKQLVLSYDETALLVSWLNAHIDATDDPPPAVLRVIEKVEAVVSGPKEQK